MDSLSRIRSRAEGRRRGEYRAFEHVQPGVCFVQGDQNIANQAGASFRSDLNNELQALVTLSSGTAAPGTTYAHQYWADTTNNLLKKRNAANSGWIVVRTLDETFLLSRSSNTILGVSDVGKTFDATASFTQTFTAAATLADGWAVGYRVETGQSITFDPNASENIDGATTKVVSGPCSGWIYCNGSAFFTVGFGADTSAGFTTGDVKLSIKTTADTGWVMMNDGTIGDGTSGGTTRANADTSALYTLLWNNTADADCPVSTGRGGSAAADFAAHKTITLPKALGRAMAGYGAGSGLTSRALGSKVGAETLPAHTHTLDAGAGQVPSFTGGAFTDQGTGGSAKRLGATDSTGTGSHGVMQPSVFLGVMIKL